MIGAVTPRVVGSTEVYAIIGDPIAQAKSPELMNDHFMAHNRDAILVPFRVAPGDLASFIATFRATTNFRGLIVTVPHKIAVAKMVDVLGGAAARTGSVNAIVKAGDGRLHGENFDGLGFVDGLTKAGWHPRGKRCLVVGAGGAGVAITDALAAAGISEIALHDVDADRREALIAQLRSNHPQLTAFAGAPAAAGYDLAINCTPQGMGRSKGISIDLADATRPTWIADIVMDPQDTPLLVDARGRGLRVHYGKEMLLNQIERFGAFFGTLPSST